MKKHRVKHPVVLISRQVMLLTILVERALALNHLKSWWQGETNF